MATLTELAKKYDVFEKSDKADFQRKARILQSMWREAQGYPMGQHDGAPSGSLLPMPWAQDTLANFLTEPIRDIVRTEVLGENQAQGRLFGTPRIFNNLLSSQPLCFNLFAELQRNPSLATQAFQKLTHGRVCTVKQIEFEYSPGRSDSHFTADNSAFDVFVEYKTDAADKGFVGIEVKYHEDLNTEPAPHRSRYDEVEAKMNCFTPEATRKLRTKPLEQIWRDHLLAGATRQAGGYADGFFAFVYPEGNLFCREAIRSYRECLTTTDSFEVWTLEAVCSAIMDFCADDWIRAFRDRYLAFEKLELE